MLNSLTEITILAAATAEGAANSNPLAEISKTFDLKLWLFVAQVINFIIVILILKKFAFGPVQEMLETRRARIADSEEKLKEIEQQLADSEARTQAAIEKANADAQRLIDEAKESSAALSERKAQESVAAAKQILAKAEAAAAAERVKMSTSLKKEFGRLVADSTSQVSGKVLNKTDLKRINEEALTFLKN